MVKDLLHPAVDREQAESQIETLNLVELSG